MINPPQPKTLNISNREKMIPHEVSLAQAVKLQNSSIQEVESRQCTACTDKT